MLLQCIIFVLSLAALYQGGQWLISGGEKIGHCLGLSPLAIGFFLVAFGTSLPELVVSHLAAIEGHPGIALGNVMGSNISNLLLIMGVAALFCPLSMGRGKLAGKLFIHTLLMTSLAIIFALGRLNFLSAIPLLGFYLYSLYPLLTGKGGEQAKVNAPTSTKIGPWVVVKFIGGIILLGAGGEYLVNSTSSIALAQGVDEYIISAIFVALGTSIPELVTVLISCRKPNASDLIVGNVIGSNIFNVACVLGTLGIYNIPIEQNFAVETLGPALVSMLLLLPAYSMGQLSWATYRFGSVGISLPIPTKGWRFYRLEGVAALICYGGAVLYWLK